MTAFLAVRAAALACACLGALAAPARAEDGPEIVWPDPAGGLAIRRPFGASEIVLRLSSRNAGAVDSLTWAGTEFVNSFDHGRELQSASAFDAYGECLNPTEAGSAADGTGGRSTSLLTGLRHGRAWVEAETRMAYWLAPGQTSAGCARGAGPYSGALSEHTLRKRAAVGLPGIPNAIEIQASFDLPHAYDSATFEVLTAYMPPGFSQFWTFDPRNRTLAPLSHDSGEQGLPVILATPDGSRAMGVWSPGLPQPGRPNLGYGRFDFAALPGAGNATVKWNCVFREAAPAAGPHDYACYAVIGSLADVQAGMAALANGPP
ncbi:hypothetical protein [uncultured Methylobacterium sp.]|uniref:hypothetical protein n=1 Tax=uncultured Methylobacterium sp. TaxID=157278 RepID=UPI0035CA5B77